MLAKIRYLYTSHDRKAQQFRYVLLALDALSLLFISGIRLLKILTRFWARTLR
jgi:hypothetical protein